MPLSLAYWILMLLWAVIGIWWGTTTAPPYRIYGGAWGLVLFLLFLIIGMRLFGAPLHS